MEAEDLVEDKVIEMGEPAARASSLHWMGGPYRLEGSNRCYNVYKYRKFKAFMKIAYLPNAYEKTIINDFQNGVDMSTFLADGNILVKMFHRFLIFSSEGNFIAKVSFEEHQT